MIRSALTLFVLALGLVAPAAAAGQAASTLYTGTTVGTAPTGQRDTGDSEVGIRVLGNGRATVRAMTHVSCARGRLAEVAKRGTARIESDGSFRAILRRSTQLESRGFRSRIVVTGRIEGPQATGTVATTARGGSANLRNCRGSIGFVARNAPVLGDAAAPAPADALLSGMTSRARGGPFGIGLRVSGGRITKIVASFRSGCRRLPSIEETNYSPPTDVAPDGSFVKNERFTIRFTDAVDRVRFEMSGRFVEGGAKGVLRARVVSRSRRTGRVTDRCDTGRVRWSAAPA